MGFSYLTWALQAPPDGMQHIIWAFSRTPPESADEDSHISVHHKLGSSVLNLTRTTAGAAPVSEGEEDSDAPPLPSSVPSAEAGDDGGEDDEDKVDSDVGNATRPTTGAASAIGNGGGGFASFVHAGLCILAFLVVIPSGALVVRYAKATGSSAAFSLHRNLQFGVGVCRFRLLVRPASSDYLTYSPTFVVRFLHHRGLYVGLFVLFLIFTAGTSIAGGMLAYLFMDSNGSGATHKVSEMP